MQLRFALPVLATLVACSGGGGGSSSGGGTTPGTPSISGFLTMTGADTAALGTTLMPSDHAVGKHMLGEPYQLILIGENATIPQDEYIDPDFADPGDFTFADPNNSFVISVADDTTVVAQGVSMTAVVGGVPYSYACSTPGPFIDCGSLSIDFTAQTATFVDVVVQPTGSSSSSTANLVLNGMLAW